MSTPSDELRAAAKVLRETAAEATPGPWTFTPDLYWKRGAITSMSPNVQGWDVLVMDVHSDLEHGNAAWAALTSPALAEPDAELLDVIAEFAEEYGIHEHIDGEPCDDFACRIVVAALATARALNVNRGAK